MTDAEQVAMYVECVFEPEDLVEVRAIPAKPKPSQAWTQASELCGHLDTLVKFNLDERNIYIGPNPRSRRGGTAKDVALARCLFVDIDDGVTPEEALHRCSVAGLPGPTLVVNSGHGVHLYWRLQKPFLDLSRWSLQQKQLIAKLGADSRIHDAPRMMRLPGFLNCKNEPHVPCSIYYANAGQSYALESLLPVLERVTESTEENRSQQKNTDAISCQVCENAELNSQIDQAIHDALPSRVGKRHEQVFQLARHLKAIPAIADAPAKELWPYVKRWHELGLAKGVIGTESFEVTRYDFLKAWKNVKYPAGTGVLDQVFTLARTLAPPPEAANYQPPGMKLLTTACSILQKNAGSGPFYLGCHTAGKHLNLDHMTAYRWLILMVDDGVLEVVEPGTPGGPKATRYRYLGGRVGDVPR